MTVDSIASAQACMTEIYADAKIEGVTSYETLEALKAVFLIPIQPQAISEFGEFIYARADEFSDEIKAEAAEVLSFATMMGWWELSQNNRGNKIMQVLRGETPEGDLPVPYARFKITPPESIPEPPAPPPPPEEPEQPPNGP